MGHKEGVASTYPQPKCSYTNDCIDYSHSIQSVELFTDCNLTDSGTKGVSRGCVAKGRLEEGLSCIFGSLSNYSQ